MGGDAKQAIEFAWPYTCVLAYFDSADKFGMGYAEMGDKRYQNDNYTTDTYWFLPSEQYLALLVWNRVSGPDYTEIRKRP